ncbi:MAG: DUF4097 family beta strand repeat protein [Oscillospiraceae bacterium]|nr:DUF4097 family beta strand repeat protein [Oscillospiraceae bacterium]MBQ1730562.1 DUF4097 family beta strand repeat protein [Oscillospiraceae bacterium]MBQ2057014.1 DUF4097 family beta strand repeat protein [Oscillospiraceae bacterium]
MKKLAIVGAVILLIGVLTAAGGFIAAKGDFSVLDIDGAFWRINTGKASETERVERTFMPDGLKKLEISTISDSVKFGVSNDGLIHVAYYAETNKEYAIKEGGGVLSVSEKRTKNSVIFNFDFSFSAGDTTVLIPEGLTLNLDVTTVSGRAEVIASGGETTVETTSGAVHLEGSASSLKVTTVSGSVRLSGFAADKIKVETVSGSVTGSLSGSQEDYAVDFSTVSGSCNLERKSTGSKKLEVSTISGSVQLSFAG